MMRGTCGGEQGRQVGGGGAGCGRDEEEGRRFCLCGCGCWGRWIGVLVAAVVGGVRTVGLEVQR